MVQNIRGVITDNVLMTPISNATVTLLNTNQSVNTDSAGNFRFRQIGVGIQSLKITHLGYKETVMPNLILNAGKELVLAISMESKVQLHSDIVIKTDRRRNKPNNEMSLVSASAFTVEETQKYAAAVNDPLRMATNFAGVVGADDGNNNIVIRGNSPATLLWRMEGVDIPNPNHFSNAGSSGGGISILSSQLLANSDFITGAFAAEYGNAIGGVFDLKLRKGNNEKNEFAIQAGVLGLNVSAEGPFKRNYKGSYLVNYRYSTLSVLSKIGVLPNQNPTNFQDLSYHINLPTKKAGTFTIFGFGGLSNQDSKTLKDSADWKEEFDRYASTFISNTGMSAITHFIKTGKKSTLKSALSFSKTETADDVLYAKSVTTILDYYKEKYSTTKISFTTAFNHKFSAASALRMGLIVNKMDYNYYQKSRQNSNEPLREVLNAKGSTGTAQGYMQWHYKTAGNITFITGLHYLQLQINNKSVVEPRLSVKWEITPKQSLAFGFGQHSQMQALGFYFARATDNNGMQYLPNKDLDFTHARHYVLSHNFLLSRNLKLRTELYFQQLYKVPVSSSDTNTFSTLNITDDFITDPLVNKGRGTNYGLEISLEKYLHHNFYYMISNSFYQSKYVARDGMERNTRFNGGYVGNMVAGKEFVTENQHRSFGINIKLVYAGGFRETPIDIEKSRIEGITVYQQKEAFTNQIQAYYRSDIRVSMKWNKKHITSTLSLDLQNATNRKNVFGNYYDSLKEKVVTYYQNGLLPVLNYKIEF